jgi:putative endonuclease
LTTVWHLYVIECADGTLYTGITTDIAGRVAAHNSGKGARYTRSRLPVVLAASSGVGTKSQALRAEFAIKRLPREKKVEAVRQARARRAR